MGTRSVTYFYDADGCCVCIVFLQYDGDLSYYGVDLGQFLMEHRAEPSMHAVVDAHLAHFIPLCGGYPVTNYNMEQMMELGVEYIYQVSPERVGVDCVYQNYQFATPWEEWEARCEEEGY